MTKDERILDCHHCGKTRHLYVNVVKQVYHCKRCNASGRMAVNPSGFTLVGNRPSLNFEETVRRVKTVEYAAPPDNWDPSPFARAYLLSRRAHPSVVVNECEEGLFIPFPFFKFWQVRKWRGKPRWISSKSSHSPATGVCFLVAPHTSSDRVIIVEGVFDAMKVAWVENAAAILGHHITDAQARWLQKRGFKEAGVLLDSDVSLDSAVKTVKSLVPYMQKVTLLSLPSDRKDPSECDLEELKERIG